MTAASLLAMIAAVSAVHVGGMALAGRLFGLVPQEVALFFGPKLVRRAIGRTTFTVGLIPLGGFVKYRSDELSVLSITSLPPLKYVVVVSSGCAALVGMGLLLGADLFSFGRGFTQAMQGAWSPKSVGAPLLRQLVEGARLAPLATLGPFAMKMAALNLLPIPVLNGFEVLVGLASAAQRKRFPQRYERLRQAANVLGLLLGLGWLAAIFFALRA